MPPSTPPATLDQPAIALRIPHQGAMCLLERVLVWDADRIRCSASSHRAADNPLRARGHLGAACGIEYAAQAMAVHGSLVDSGIGQSTPRMGLLTSVRAVECCVPWLDDTDADLIVAAERLSGDRNAVLYGFTLHAGDRLLVSGRAAVILDADAIGATR